MKSRDRMVIIGAGHCGARTAHALRLNGWEGEISLLGNEGLAPYDRPPLSKSVLLREKPASDCALYDDAFYRDNAIDIRVNAGAIEIDRGSRQVGIQNGNALTYHRLLIATGAEPRRLAVPGATLDGVHVLRSLPDARHLREKLLPDRRIVIIGAGFIGLEIAASAVARGCKVVVVEAAAHALMRAVPEAVSAYLIDKHRQNGVDVRFAVQVERFTGSTHATGVELSDGSRLSCDLVVVGIGVVPRTGLAEAAGIDTADGIAVDDTLGTNDPDVFAAGDVCSFPSRLFRRRMRLECWKNAEDQARIVARNMLGHGETYSEVPWFWSEQYDVAIQIAGMPAFGVTTIWRELSARSRLSFAIDREGVLVGASGMGDMAEIARDVRVAQHLIARRSQIDSQQLADAKFKLKSLLAVSAA